MTAKSVHGLKRRFQVLLDPHRAALFDALAEKEGLKTAAFLRNQLYEALELSVSRAKYNQAADKDSRLLTDRRREANARAADQ